MTILRDRRVRVFIYTLVFLIGFVVLVFTSLAPDGSALRGTGGFGVSGSAITEEAIRNFPDGKIGLVAAIPALRVVPAGSSRFDDLDQNLIRFQLEDFGFILLDKDPARDADRLCIDGLHIAVESVPRVVDEKGRALYVGVNLLEGGDPLCFRVNAIGDAALKVDTRVTVLNRETTPRLRSIYYDFFSPGEPFWYPFDGHTLPGAAQITYRILSGAQEVDGGNIDPVAAWVYETSGNLNWNIRLQSSPEVQDAQQGQGVIFGLTTLRTGKILRFNFTFTRPLILRLATPFLIVVMIAVIMLLAFVESLDSLFEICVGLLFGIFGLKQVIAPSENVGQTMMDVVFIGLYVLLAVTLMIILLSKLVYHLRHRRTAEPTK